jgi:hypothetical protein
LTICRELFIWHFYGSFQFPRRDEPVFLDSEGTWVKTGDTATLKPNDAPIAHIDPIFSQQSW